MLGKSPDTGISLHGGPFPSEGNLVCGGGADILGNLIDKWRRPLVVGQLSARDSIEGTLRERPFIGEPKKMRFLRDMQNALYKASLSIGALLGNLVGVRLRGHLREKYIWVPCLDPEAIKIFSLGGVWNFSKGTGLS